MSRKKISPDTNNNLSRRDFARNAALLAVAVAAPMELSTATVEMQSSAQPSVKFSPEAEAQYQTIITKYGSRLSVEQKSDIRRLIGDGQKGTATLRAFPLDNSDEPANMFRVTQSKKR